MISVRFLGKCFAWKRTQTKGSCGTADMMMGVRRLIPAARLTVVGNGSPRQASRRNPDITRSWCVRHSPEIKKKRKSFAISPNFGVNIG